MTLLPEQILMMKFTAGLETMRYMRGAVTTPYMVAKATINFTVKKATIPSTAAKVVTFYPERTVATSSTAETATIPFMEKVIAIS